MPETADHLETYITGIEEDRGVGGRISEAWRAAWTNGNPSAYLQQVRATQSTSSAHGFVYLRNPELYDLMDEMAHKDTAIRSAVDLVVAELLNAPIYFEPADESDAAKEAADIAETYLLEMDGYFDLQNALSTLLSGFNYHGFAVTETLFTRKDNLIAPEAIIHRHPGQFAFTERGKLLLVTDKHAWARAAGGTESIYAEEAYPYKFTIARQPGALYGNPYGTPSLLPLQYNYRFRLDALKAWVEYAEVYGFPLAKATIPQGIPNRDRIKTELANIFSELRKKSAFTVPEGVVIDFVERAVGKGTSPFVELVKWLSEEETRYILGATLQVMEAKFGTRAQAETHGDVAKKKNRPRASAVERAVQIGLVRPFFEINFGARYPMPRFVIDTEDEDDVETTDKVLRLGRELGLKIARKYAHERLGIPIPEEGEDVLEIRTPPAPMQFPPQLQIGPRERPPQPEDRKPQDQGDDEDEEEDFHKHGHFHSFARSSAALEKDIRGRLTEIAESVASLEITAQEERLGAALGVLRDYDKGTPLSALPPIGVDALTVKPEMLTQTKRALHAARLLQVLSASNVIREVAEAVPFSRAITFAKLDEEALEQIDPVHRDAVRWMIERKVMTVPEVRQLAAALSSSVGDTLVAAQVERAVRQQVLAIAHTRNVQAVERLQTMISSAVADGRTVGDFLDAVDELRESGALPAGTDAHIRTVYNTEVSNAYNAQRREIEAAPVFKDHLWGYRLVSALKESSRPGHKALHGKLVRKGSAVDLALGDPPYDYNCECLKVAIVVDDVNGNHGYEETLTMDDVARVERF
jgi:phage gp29-like protein